MSQKQPYVCKYLDRKPKLYGPFSVSMIYDNNSIEKGKYKKVILYDTKRKQEYLGYLFYNNTQIETGTTVYLQARMFTISTNTYKCLNIDSVQEIKNNKSPEKVKTSKNRDYNFKIYTYIDKIKDENIREFAKKLFADKHVVDKFFVCPASLKGHSSVPGGLAKHTLDVVNYVCFSSVNEEPIVRDLSIFGALIHDIGKINVFTEKGNGFCYNLTGSLLGHKNATAKLFYEKLREYGPLDKDIVNLIENIIYAQHNSDYDVACTKPALYVKLADNTAVQLENIENLEKGYSNDFKKYHIDIQEYIQKNSFENYDKEHFEYVASNDIVQL